MQNEKEEKEQNRKTAILTSAKGVIYLVLVMIGIFCITSLMKLTGLTSGQQEVETRKEKELFEEAKHVKEVNAGLKLKEEPEFNTGIADLPLTMHLRVAGYENGILKLEVENRSGFLMEYKKEWKLQREDTGDWKELGTLKELSDGTQTANAEGEGKKESLMDLTKAALSCDLNLLGELRAGEYRILMGDLEASFALEEVEE